jgi:8-oxo-dGTP diphosphatase
MEQLLSVDYRGRRISPPGCSGTRVDVWVVLFTVSDGRVSVAHQERRGYRALLRRVPTPGESLDAVGTGILANQIVVAGRYQERFYSISRGSEGDWTVNVTYLALARTEAADSARSSAAWFGVAAHPHRNPVDRRIVDNALLRLRAKLEYIAIGFHLPPSFTLSEPQAVHEAVLDREVDKRNFRRRIHALGLLQGTGESRRQCSHHPAWHYRLRTAHDAETDLTPDWATRPVRKAANR